MTATEMASADTRPRTGQYNPIPSYIGRNCRVHWKVPNNLVLNNLRDSDNPYVHTSQVPVPIFIRNTQPHNPSPVMAQTKPKTSSKSRPQAAKANVTFGPSDIPFPPRPPSPRQLPQPSFRSDINKYPSSYMEQERKRCSYRHHTHHRSRRHNYLDSDIDEDTDDDEDPNCIYPYPPNGIVPPQNNSPSQNRARFFRA